MVPALGNLNLVSPLRSTDRVLVMTSAAIFVSSLVKTYFRDEISPSTPIPTRRHIFTSAVQSVLESYWFTLISTHAPVRIRTGMRSAVVNIDIDPPNIIIYFSTSKATSKNENYLLYSSIYIRVT